MLSEAEQRAPLAGLRGVAADTRLALVDLRFHGGRAGIGRVDVLRVVDDASQVFIEVGDEAGLARALNLGGKLRFWSGEAATAVRELDRAAQHAHLAGARAEEADSLHYICVALRRGPTPADEGLERIEEIGLRNEQSRALETVCLVSRAGLEAMLGRFDVARGLLAKATASAQQLGREVLIDAHIRVAAADVELLAGEPEAAEELLRLSCGRLEQIGELGFLASTVPSLVEAVLAQGRTDEALELSDRWRPEDLTVPEDVDAQVAWRRVRAMALSRLGQLDEAERLAREAIDTAATTDFTELHASALAVLGEVLRLSGRAQESTAALEQAVTLFEAKGNLVALQRVRTLLDSAGRRGLISVRLPLTRPHHDHRREGGRVPRCTDSPSRGSAPEPDKCTRVAAESDRCQISRSESSTRRSLACARVRAREKRQAFASRGPRDQARPRTRPTGRAPAGQPLVN